MVNILLLLFSNIYSRSCQTTSSLYNATSVKVPHFHPRGSFLLRTKRIWSFSPPNPLWSRAKPSIPRHPSTDSFWYYYWPYVSSSSYWGQCIVPPTCADSQTSWRGCTPCKGRIFIGEDLKLAWGYLYSIQGWFIINIYGNLNWLGTQAAVSSAATALPVLLHSEQKPEVLKAICEDVSISTSTLH